MNVSHVHSYVREFHSRSFVRVTDICTSVEDGNNGRSLLNASMVSPNLCLGNARAERYLGGCED